MAKDEATSNSLELKLFEERGETSRFTTAEIKETGDLVVLCQDVGKAPEEWRGDSDYEFWATVKQEDKDKLLLALIEKLYGGHFSAVDEFRTFLELKGIPFEWMTWA
jgi:hypothetical protein